MVSFYGDYDTTETVVIPFNSFDSNDPSASVTLTNLASTDVYIYKDGSLTQRTSFAGIAVDVDVDAIAGCHWVTVDLSDNTDAGFYVAGSRYQVRIEGVTIDGATVNAWIGAFSIGCTLRPTTAGRTLDVNATGEAGLDLDNTSGTIDAAQLGADCITSAKIADDAFLAVNFGTGCLTADAFAADALVAATFATGAFTADAFAADALVAATFATGAFTADAFAANALVAATFAASSLDGKGDWNTVVPDAAGVAPTVAEITADMDANSTQLAAIILDTAEIGTAGVGLTNVGGSANNWSTHAAGDVWAVDATTQQTQGTFGQAIGDPIADTTTIYQAVATDATGDNVAVDVVALKAETALIVADTAELQGNQGDWATAVGFATPTNITAGTITTVSGNVDGNVAGTVTLANGAHGGAAASIELADYSDFTGAAAANPNVLQSGTITVTDQTNFVLNAGSADDDAYVNMVCVIEDAATATQKSVRTITAYVGATKTVTIDSAPDFTIASTDNFDILAVAPGSTPPTAAAVADAVWDEASAGHTDAGKAGAQLWTDIDAILVDTNSLNDTKVPQTLNLTASGNIGIDWANVENPTTAVDLSATDIQLCDTVTTLTTLPTIPANWLTAAGTHADFGTEIGAAVLSALGTGSWITAAALVSTGLDAVTAWTVDITGDITTVGSVTTKTGYSLANTGADLILKDSTFVLAIADAVWDEARAGHVAAGSFGIGVADTLSNSNAIVDDTDLIDDATSGLAKIATDVAAILLDTNELQADDIPTTLATLATTAELDKVPKSDGTVTWNATALASVNAEVDTALVTTTYAEPGQGTPAATASLKDKIGYLYKGWRNRSNQTATTYQLFNDDAVTVDQKATVSDDATTAEKGEVATGP